ncbi:hypothetical protein FACS1894176_10640 [Bacteroidia bacterium]|jgi:hypothetical protein|nr:hypothetical protein FACS1894176_10640 [Bacteroidia bacterium]
MKALVILMSLLLSVAAKADDDNVLAGQFRSCVPWTTINGFPTSKKFELAFPIDSSLHLIVSFYDRSANCEGDPSLVRSYGEFTALEDSGNRMYRTITAKSEDSNLYFKFMFNPKGVVIFANPSMPVKEDAQSVMVLDRVD